MSKSNHYIFVLWGDHFEEAAAAIFVTELRKAGMLVKLVGLNSQYLSGANGLKLVPDLTLGQALARASQAICIIIPCSLTDFQQHKQDPRLHEFIKQAQANRAKFVIKSADQVEGTVGFSPTVYPEGENLLKFVGELTESLNATGSSRL